MAKNHGRWFIWGTLLLSLVFTALSGILYIVTRDEHVKVILSLLLTSFFLWLLLLCCGWKIYPSLNPFRSRLSFLFWFISFLLVLFFIVYAFHLVGAYERYNKVSIGLTDSSLIQFNLSYSPSVTTGLINYTIALKFSITQGRQNQGIYFSTFKIFSYYQRQPFSSLSLPPFYVTEKLNNTFNSSTVELHPILHGLHEIPLSVIDLDSFQQDAASMMFRIPLIVMFSGFRCNHCHHINSTCKVPLKQMVKGDLRFDLKEISLPNGTGEWEANVDPATVLIPCGYCFIIFFIIRWLALYLKQVWLFKESFQVLLCLSQITSYYLILELIKRHKLPFEASGAALSNFAFSPYNSTLSYNFSVAVTIGPNNKWTGICFTELAVEARYRGYNFTTFSLSSPSYLQGRQEDGGRKLVFHLRVEEKSVILLAGDSLQGYEKDKISGCYRIDFWLSYGGFKSDGCHNLQGKKVTGLVKLKRKFPESCN